MHIITKIYNNDFRRRSRKVLLLVDNAAWHNIKKETKTKLTNVLSNFEKRKEVDLKELIAKIYTKLDLSNKKSIQIEIY